MVEGCLSSVHEIMSSKSPSGVLGIFECSNDANGHKSARCAAINLLDVQQVGGYLSSESIARWLRESVSQRNGNIVILNEFPLVLCESTRRVVGWPSMHFTALLTH